MIPEVIGVTAVQTGAGVAIVIRAVCCLVSSVATGKFVRDWGRYPSLRAPVLSPFDVWLIPDKEYLLGMLLELFEDLSRGSALFTST